MTSGEPSFIHVTVVAGEPVEVQVSVNGSGSKVRLSMLGRADKTMRYQSALKCLYVQTVHELQAVKECVTPVPSKYIMWDLAYELQLKFTSK